MQTNQPTRKLLAILAVVLLALAVPVAGLIVSLRDIWRKRDQIDTTAIRQQLESVISKEMPSPVLAPTPMVRVDDPAAAVEAWRVALAGAGAFPLVSETATGFKLVVLLDDRSAAVVAQRLTAESLALPPPGPGLWEVVFEKPSAP